jgi:hypothetical protein
MLKIYPKKDLPMRFDIEYKSHGIFYTQIKTGWIGNLQFQSFFTFKHP